MKTFTCTHKAQYYETDQMGIIHHSNYIRWFEEARVDFLEQIGYPYGRLEEEGILSPVLEISCRYQSMVHFGDLVDILISIEAFNGVKLAFHYEVRDHDTQEIRTVGTSRHCFMKKDGTLVSLKRNYPSIYEALQKYQ